MRKIKGVYKVSQEQVLEVDRYCSETGVSIRARIQELNLSESAYYRCKRYMAQEKKNREGEFVSIVSGSAAPFPEPVARRKAKSKKETESAEAMTIELRLLSGAEMRLSGDISRDMLLTILTNV